MHLSHGNVQQIVVSMWNAAVCLGWLWAHHFLQRFKVTVTPLAGCTVA
jgi:hypothetical protein